jgi:hypothetical protein
VSYSPIDGVNPRVIREVCPLGRDRAEWFARNRAADRAFWFLGPGTYVSHEGERPMAVTWRLDMPLPGDLFASFAAAVA